MSKSYTVASGDTLFRISTRFYGDGRKYPRIVEANSIIKNPDLIFPGWVLVIPDLVEREIEEDSKDFPEEVAVSPDSIDVDGNSNEVSVLLDGNILRLWESVDIVFNFDTIGDTFSITFPFDPRVQQNRDNFRPFKYKEIAIYVGGKKILTGFLINISTSSEATSKKITIDGYSKPAILADVTVSSNSYPVQINGLNLKQIATKLASPFGIKVLFEADPGAVFKSSDKVRYEPEQKIYDFLANLAKQRGLVISSNEFGQMVFKKTTDEIADISLVEGKPPFLSATTSYSGQERFSSITILRPETKKGAGQSFSVDDNELKGNSVNRPLVAKAGDVNAGGLETTALAKLGRTIAESIKLNINVVGWFRPDGILWRDNQKVVVKSDGNMIYNETDFLIRNVSLSKTPESLTASLDLVLPESYSGQVIKIFPWTE